MGYHHEVTKAEYAALEEAERRAQKERERILIAARDQGAIGRGELQLILQQQADALLMVRGRNIGKIRGEMKAKGARAHIERTKQALREIQAENAAQAPRPRYVSDKLVYVIGAKGHPMKIGIASDVESRLSKLQTGCPHRLKVYHSQEVPDGGARKVEAECHRRLAESRLSGEWFDVDADLAIQTVIQAAQTIAP